MLAYTNLEKDQNEEVPSSEWRRSSNTRNQTAKNNLEGDSSIKTTSDNMAKFLDTSGIPKRPEMKDHIKSVKQQHRQKSLVSSSGAPNSTTAAGPQVLD